MMKKRGGWLAALFIGETLTATAMGHYEHEIAPCRRRRIVRPADHQQRRKQRLAGDVQSSSARSRSRKSPCASGRAS
jgi:hypothetical protein